MNLFSSACDSGIKAKHKNNAHIDKHIIFLNITHPPLRKYLKFELEMPQITAPYII